MVYISALLGGLMVNVSIAVMALMQDMYKGENCKKARYAVLGALILAVVCSSFMLLLEWMPMVGEVMASLAAVACLVAISGALGYAAYETGITDCAKARMYSIILIIIMMLCALLVLILTFV
jgi:hypothetical protein